MTCWLFHDWRWFPIECVTYRHVIQYATCTRCGKTKAREVLL